MLLSSLREEANDILVPVAIYLNLRLTISVLVFSSFSPSAFQSTAPAGIDDNDNHQHNDIDNGNSPPVGLDVLQHAGSACIAVKTQLSLRIAPRSAVRVGAP